MSRASILLSAAVSPGYDLRPALRATWGEVVSFYSDNDQFVLNWGTTHFGTIDRIYGPSAGLHGFALPDKLTLEDRLLYRRLIQIPWTSAMIAEGYFGSHAGTNNDFVLIKYDAAGTQQWLRTYNGPGSLDDNLIEAGMDAAGFGPGVGGGGDEGADGEHILKFPAGGGAGT